MNDRGLSGNIYEAQISLLKKMGKDSGCSYFLICLSSI